MTRRKKPAREVSAEEPLSAHEAGKLQPHGAKGGAPAPQKVTYGSDEDSEPRRPLTVREGELLADLAEGLSNKEISQDKNLAVKTVGKHFESVYRKLRVRSRAAAAIWFLKRRNAELEEENGELRRLLAECRQKQG